MIKSRLMTGLLITILLPLFSFAQVTSGSIEGTIIDAEGQEIAYANVLAIHTATGTEYGVFSMDNGRYVLDNLKPGGPYQLKITFVGYQDVTQNDIYVALGNATQLDIKLQAEATTLDVVEITIDKNDPFSNDKEGLSANIDGKILQETPTLNRSIQDVTRLSPQGGQSSFGGSNYRYNNLSIDGASNNDVLGFQEPASGAAGSVASNTPGALAGTQPISLDALQEVQVGIAPYDVQQGNFTGASINAVTRSGNNRVEGSVYFFGRNQWITGKSVDESREAIADYYDFQTGFRIGAPIVKNKLFVFANYEKTKRREPVLNAPGSAGTQISEFIAEAISDTLLSRYGFDIGSYGEIFNERKSDKLFLRFDLNLGKKHQLTIRDNYVSASSDNLERGANFLKFASQGFTHNSTTNSLVGELKSRLGNTVFNHLMVGYNTVHDERTYDSPVLPHLEITYNSANTIFAGTYREASVYGLTLNTTQLSDNLKIYKNKHTITIGTNNDFYDIQYRFLTAWNGRWEYKSLDDFFADRPKRIRGVYNYTNNSFEFNKNNPSADFRVFLLSGYLQDKYRFNDRFMLSGGIRIDMQVHPDKVPLNPKVVNTPAFAHFNNDFGAVPQINPRIAFQYVVNEDKTIQLRGGSGLFTGRIPFAWYAYSHYISGLNYGNVDLKPDSELPITTDLSDLQQFQPNLTEINLIDNDFKLPRQWKSSLGVDIKLPQDILLTLDGMFSKTITDIWFRSINLNEEKSSLDGADNRLYYTQTGADNKINPNFTNVFLLSNTDEGYSYFLTANASKKIGQHLNLNLAYTYGESKDLMNGVRNSMAANFNWNQVVDSSNPALSYSNFDVRHRIVSTLNYSLHFGEKQKTAIALIYTGRSGFPFSYTIAGDLNKDGSSKNDLFYVPNDQSEIALSDIENTDGDIIITADEQWEQLDRYISNDQYLNSKRGEYTERNGGRAPWNHLLDLRLSHQLKLGEKRNAHRLEITLDVLNVLNLFHYQWGLQSYVPNVQNSSYQLIDFEGIENNKPVYQFNNPQGTPWQTDALNSRWQAQLGLRYSF